MHKRTILPPSDVVVVMFRIATAALPKADGTLTDSAEASFGTGYVLAQGATNPLRIKRAK